MKTVQSYVTSLDELMEIIEWINVLITETVYLQNEANMTEDNIVAIGDISKQEIVIQSLLRSCRSKQKNQMVRLKVTTKTTAP